MKEELIGEELKVKRTKCICPKCFKSHTKRMSWSSKLRPSIYCKSCISNMNQYNNEEYKVLLPIRI